MVWWCAEEATVGHGCGSQDAPRWGPHLTTRRLCSGVLFFSTVVTHNLDMGAWGWGYGRGAGPKPWPSGSLDQSGKRSKPLVALLVTSQPLSCTHRHGQGA